MIKIQSMLYSTAQYGYSVCSKGMDQCYWGMHNAKKTSIYNTTSSTMPGDKTGDGVLISHISTDLSSKEKPGHLVFN